MALRGTTVIFVGHMSNGINEHPAIVTRDWGDGMVNLTVFPDYGSPFNQGSVYREGDPRCYGGLHWKPNV